MKGSFPTLAANMNMHTPFVLDSILQEEMEQALRNYISCANFANAKSSLNTILFLLSEYQLQFLFLLGG